MQKIKEFWASLEDVATISKRELFFGLVSCTLAGVVLGVIFTPKKTVIIGSHNGNGCKCKHDMQDEIETDGCD